MAKKKPLATRLVEEAESWIGTPFRHQGNLKGIAVDCAQFIAAVARDAGVKDLEIPGNYRQREDGAVMMRILSEHMDFVDTRDRRAGDVLALCDEALHSPEIPRHLAFVQKVSPTTTFIIHASERGVVAHRMNMHWLSRIHSCWRIKSA